MFYHSTEKGFPPEKKKILTVKQMYAPNRKRNTSALFAWNEADLKNRRQCMINVNLLIFWNNISIEI